MSEIKKQKIDFVYRLELIYPINANLYDENQKPLWPQGIAMWPIILKDKIEFNRVNKDLKLGKDVIIINKGGDFKSGLRVNLSNVLAAEMKVYIPEKESLIISPTGDKFHKPVH